MDVRGENPELEALLARAGGGDEKARGLLFDAIARDSRTWQRPDSTGGSLAGSTLRTWLKRFCSRRTGISGVTYANDPFRFIRGWFSSHAICWWTLVGSTSRRRIEACFASARRLQALNSPLQGPRLVRSTE